MDNSHKYDKIKNHPHHVSQRHPQLSRASYAARFSPFAALTGYDDIVKEVARSTNEIMKKYNGMSFHRAVTLRRLRVAIELFETTSLTVEQISSSVGFPSRVAFTRAFSARYGLPPGKYRRIYCSKKPASSNFVRQNRNFSLKKSQ